MSARNKAVVDLQFLLGDTLIKAGVALVMFTLAVAALVGMGLREAIFQGLYGYASVLVGFVVLALGLWQSGRLLRREATIRDV
jgi:urea transporter